MGILISSSVLEASKDRCFIARGTLVGGFIRSGENNNGKCDYFRGRE